MPDNFTAGATTFKSKDVGGDVHAVSQTIVDETGADAMGAAAANPGANTLLGRLKAIAEALTGKATEAKQDANTLAIEGLKSPHYQVVAASSVSTKLGAVGAVGDMLATLTIIPATKSPGAVTVKDGAGAAITVFTGGADSVSTLHPFTFPLGTAAKAAGWSVTTGANVSVIATGRFS
ncbi:hypothetical protein [Qipengyuania sp.]|uniref:hypothetical protein n=1 Tax=Qipengyuania sp. TaxID=2004515 RepID=UPI0035C7EA17